MNIRKLPFITIPIILALIAALLFIFFVPKGGDLISSSGDFILGYIIGSIFTICLLLDIIRLIIRFIKFLNKKSDTK